MAANSGPDSGQLDANSPEKRHYIVDARKRFLAQKSVKSSLDCGAGSKAHGANENRHDFFAAVRLLEHRSGRLARYRVPAYRRRRRQAKANKNAADTPASTIVPGSGTIGAGARLPTIVVLPSITDAKVVLKLTASV
jgi:hypothetical protein